MTPALRRTLLLVIAAVLAAGALGYGVTAFVLSNNRSQAPSAVETVSSTAPPTGPRVVFRNTASGQGYGQIAIVPLDDPEGARTVVPVACDRVDATRNEASCLRTERGVVTTFSATLYDDEWNERNNWPLAGIPSRTRLSPDGSLVASTAFVTGHGYAVVGFSTQTMIRGADGTDHGNLEDFALTIDGQAVTAADRNLWGVTFAQDGRTFFATAATGGRTWLVKGDLAARTLESVRENAECPSLSPDETQIAYKKKDSTGDGTHWSVAVLDLADGTETVLPEPQSVDDQIEWLDDSTLLYGMPGAEVGDSTVWSIPSDGSAGPRVFIEHAWSPAVVR